MLNTQRQFWGTMGSPRTRVNVVKAVLLMTSLGLCYKTYARIPPFHGFNGGAGDDVGSVAGSGGLLGTGILRSVMNWVRSGSDKMREEMVSSEIQRLARSYAKSADESCREQRHDKEAKIITQGILACDRLASGLMSMVEETDTKASASIPDSTELEAASGISSDSSSGMKHLESSSRTFPAIAELFRRLAVVNVRHGDPFEAQRAADRCLQYYRRTTGGTLHHAVIDELCHELGHEFYSKRRYDVANKMWNICLESRKMTLGVRHPAVASILQHLVDLNLNANNITQAIAYCEQCLSVNLMTLPEDSSRTAETFIILGHLHCANATLDSLPKAKWCFAKAALMNERLFGIGDQESCKTYSLLTRLGTESSKIAQSKAFEAQAQEPENDAQREAQRSDVCKYELQEIQSLREAFDSHLKSLRWVRPGASPASLSRKGVSPGMQQKDERQESTIQALPLWIATAHISKEDSNLELAKLDPSESDNQLFIHQTLIKQRKAVSDWFQMCQSLSAEEISSNMLQSFLSASVAYLRHLAQTAAIDPKHALRILTKTVAHLEIVEREVHATGKSSRSNKNDKDFISILRAQVLADLGDIYLQRRSFDESIVRSGQAVDVLDRVLKDTLDRTEQVASETEAASDETIKQFPNPFPSIFAPVEHDKQPGPDQANSPDSQPINRKLAVFFKGKELKPEYHQATHPKPDSTPPNHPPLVAATAGSAVGDLKDRVKTIQGALARTHMQLGKAYQARGDHETAASSFLNAFLHLRNLQGDSSPSTMEALVALRDAMRLHHKHSLSHTPNRAGRGRLSRIVKHHLQALLDCDRSRSNPSTRMRDCDEYDTNLIVFDTHLLFGPPLPVHDRNLRRLIRDILHDRGGLRDVNTASMAGSGHEGSRGRSMRMLRRALALALVVPAFKPQLLQLAKRAPQALARLSSLGGAMSETGNQDMQQGDRDTFPFPSVKFGPLEAKESKGRVQHFPSALRTWWDTQFNSDLNVHATHLDELDDERSRKLFAEKADWPYYTFRH